MIHTFKGGADGKYPEAGLTEAGGIFYGTTFGALGTLPDKHCSKGCGNEYAMNAGTFISYFFQGGGDGAFPAGEVVLDSSNNVYGTTEYGGGTACNGLGCGTVFVVTPQGTESAFKFCPPQGFPSCVYGAFPHAGPIIGNDGNLYGTASLGGAGTGLACDNNFAGCGTVYMLNPNLQTPPTVLYSFCQLPACQDGAIPFGKLWEDSSGNFFGTTQFGGTHGAGTVFELQPNGDGSYAESVLYSFCIQTNCTDGAVPEAGLVGDDSGNLYGTASAGGGGTCTGSTPGCGAAFELSPGSGGYSYAVLHAFTGGTDGALPQAPLLFDPATSDLYGTTEKGGGGPNCGDPSVGCGTVFRLTPHGTAYKETKLHTFGNNPKRTDGAQPEGALLLYNGLLYGATRVEGARRLHCDCGTLFTINIGSKTTAKSLRVPGQSQAAYLAAKSRPAIGQ